MVDENLLLKTVFDLFIKRAKYFENFLKISIDFLKCVKTVNDPNDIDIGKWNNYLSERSAILKKIDSVEMEIFDLLDIEEKEPDKILAILRSKGLHKIIEVELSTREIIKNILQIDKNIYNSMQAHLSISLSEFAKLEYNKRNMENTYLKLPNIDPRFIDKKD